LALEVGEAPVVSRNHPEGMAERDQMPPLEWVCRTAEHLLGVDGACVAVVVDNAYRAAIHATAPVLAAIEQAQFNLSEGPALESVRRREPVLVADFARVSTRRWPVLASQLVGQPIGAFFAFPIAHGGEALGALAMYRRRPGPLPTQVLGTATALAHIAAIALLESPVADHTLIDLDHQRADEGEMADEAWATEILRDHAVLDQAVGIVMAELHIDAAQAADRLRGYAFAHEQTLTQLAGDMTSHRLHPRILDT
jgi:GAF domain-containing protein